MVHGYHIILPHYGFWLPNDPRGSWSEFVASWELARFGETTRHLDQRTLASLSAEELAVREAARKALHYPPVTLTGPQALSIANGFKDQATKSDYAIWACSILPEHTHLVIARHRIHPLQQCAKQGKRLPGMWARHQWKSFLDSDEAIENAINYVIENPIKEGKPRQNWRWLTPYAGLDPGWITYL